MLYFVCELIIKILPFNFVLTNVLDFLDAFKNEHIVNAVKNHDVNKVKHLINNGTIDITKKYNSYFHDYRRQGKITCEIFKDYLIDLTDNIKRLTNEEKARRKEMRLFLLNKGCPLGFVLVQYLDDFDILSAILLNGQIKDFTHMYCKNDESKYVISFWDTYLLLFCLQSKKTNIIL